ncbi:hypothetical protein [Bacillus toyonensis]|uniref:hypothetical protein n=1 Tax=Bacillus toyonensis TaxID=155322 RepID=UPI000BF1FA65|nr:hypothetical protein [Bacillus toyonensis]PEM64430.1 hypothetical protein CN625_01585 [Bacillus toyonensis]
MGRFKCDSCGVYVMIIYKGGLCEECYDNVKEIEKTINFEEESKVDELKVYAGKETLQALLEGKVLLSDEHQVKIDDDVIWYSTDGIDWSPSSMSLQSFLRNKFTKVVTPQVGDWVKVTYRSTNNTFIHTAKVNNIEDGKMWADWEGLHRETFYRIHQEGVSWEILTPKQIAEYKREQAFSKVRRKLNEFREGDIVMIDSLGVTAIVVSKKNDPKVQLHGINQVGKGHVAQPHQLTPIAFSENQVDLS